MRVCVIVYSFLSFSVSSSSRCTVHAESLEHQNHSFPFNFRVLLLACPIACLLTHASTRARAFVCVACTAYTHTQPFTEFLRWFRLNFGILNDLMEQVYTRIDTFLTHFPPLLLLLRRRTNPSSKRRNENVYIMHVYMLRMPYVVARLYSQYELRRSLPHAWVIYVCTRWREYWTLSLSVCWLVRWWLTGGWAKWWRRSPNISFVHVTFDCATSWPMTMPQWMPQRWTMDVLFSCWARSFIAWIYEMVIFIGNWCDWMKCIRSD